jgi:hypothetical protein
MKRRKYLWGMLAVTLIFGRGFAQSNGKIDRTAYYQAMRLDKKDLLNQQLKKLKTAPLAERQAFEGALIMKKAGLGGSPIQKLDLFKQGHKKLEAAIKREPDNVEFRFLRLMIQENAPGILGYKDHLTEDSEYIRKSYKTLPDEVQRAIEDYSKKSKILKLQVS